MRISVENEHYIFDHIARQTVGLTGRFDFAFTLNLSLQFYAQPFISAGRYNHLKQVVDPVAGDYTNHFHLLGYQVAKGGFLADVNDDGKPVFISDPDFNFKQFRTNTVPRWEYRPGSTLFTVWSRGLKTLTRQASPISPMIWGNFRHLVRQHVHGQDQPLAESV